MNGSRRIRDRFLDEVKSAPDVNAGLSSGEGSSEGLRASSPIGGTYKGRSRDVNAPERRKVQTAWARRQLIERQVGSQVAG